MLCRWEEGGSPGVDYLVMDTGDLAYPACTPVENPACPDYLSPDTETLALQPLLYSNLQPN